MCVFAFESPFLSNRSNNMKRAFTFSKTCVSLGLNVVGNICEKYVRAQLNKIQKQKSRQQSLNILTWIGYMLCLQL